MKKSIKSKMEEGDLVLCKVEKVTNTITFVRLPTGEEGTIISSEIAAGRIKLMREYVVPNKQIVCKILRIEGDHIHLSLRRVSSKEKKEVMSRYKQSQAIHTAFKQILGESEEEIKSKILEEFTDLLEFSREAKSDEKLLEKYIPSDKTEGIKKVLDKRKREALMKQTISIKCFKDDGVKRLKELFDIKKENVSIKYISAGNFTVELIVDDMKTGKREMQELIEKLQKKANDLSCEFQAKEK